MRKLFLLFWALLATTCLWAHDFQSGDLYYNITSDTTVEVTSQSPSYPYNEGVTFTTATIPETVTHNGTNYSVTSIGERTFHDCSSLTSITIPNSVTSIGDEAFYGCSSLSSVTIPNSVIRIGRSAFSNCSSLTSVTIPNSVTSIGNHAFYKCSSLTSLTIPNSVTSIGDDAFSNCISLTSITIPNSVTSIGERAFCGCSSLTSMVVEEGNTTYDSRDNCNAIIETATNTLIAGCQNTIIPNSVTSIGGNAFYYCSSLTSITIPNSVTSIGDGAFRYCSSLTSMVVEEGNITYDSRDNCNAIIETATNTLIAGCQNTIIPNSVTSIGDYAFRSCSSLTSITIPNSVTSIGNYAFLICDKLTSITIPNSVTSIGNFAFYGCSSLTSVTIPNSITSIGDYAFSVCSSLTSVTIPNSVTSIGERAFYDCSSLTSVTLNSNDIVSKETYMYTIFGSQVEEYVIGDSVTSIGDYAFSYCSSLTSVTIPNSVTSIGGWAFSDCSSLDTIYVEATTPPTIESNTFTNTPTSICYIPCGTKSAYEASAWAQYMGEFVEHAVERTSGICGENLYWEYADTKLIISGTGAMYDNIVECLPWAWLLDSIRSIEMSEGITSIANSAFSEMSLTSVVVPASVTYFGENAFAYNYNLTHFEYLGTEAYYGYYNTDDAILYNCPNLRYFKGQTDMLSYNTDDLDTVIITSGTMYDDYYHTTYIDNSNANNTYFGEGYLQDDVLAVETLLLPNGLLEIGDFALHNARHLEQITIPAGVTRIGESAFEECRSLESVTFAGTALREIDDWAFYNCHSLKDITIPEGVKSIGKAAFFDCSHLNELTLPSTVQTIEDNAFGQCAQVKKMNVKAAVPPVVESETFEDIDRSIQVLVPQGTLKLYREAPYWQEFFNIAESEVMAGVENTMTPSTTTNCQKIIRDGNLFIIRDGVEYNVMGQLL